MVEIRTYIFIVLLYIGILPNEATAQSQHPTYHISVAGGLSSYFSYDESFIVSYDVGISRVSRLEDRLFTSASILVGRRGNSYQSNRTNFAYSVKQAQLNYKIGLLLNNNFNLQIGPYFGYNFSKRFEYSIGENAISRYSVFGLSDYNTEDEFRDFEVGLSIGTGFQLNRRFSLGIDFSQALSSIYNKGNPYNVIEVADHDYTGLLLTDAEKSSLDQQLLNAYTSNLAVSIRMLLF